MLVIHVCCCDQRETHNVWTYAEASELFDAVLRGLGLVFAVLHRYQAHMDAAKVLAFHAELELAKGLNERHALDVADGSAEL